ncbi:hypothetical protein OH491_09455 [Termitidicoccus mucosus]|uniref:immunoglobulin domain-containing protein n=1 Tax=Termitidicoccus mucosus TaxID=1184151 RepID=UPI0031842730
MPPAHTSTSRTPATAPSAASHSPAFSSRQSPDWPATPAPPTGSPPTRASTPQAIAIDATGNLYITDTGNHTIRKIDAATGIVTTIAGTSGSSGSQDGLGGQSTLNSPAGIAIDETGEIYVLDTGSHTVRVLQVGPVITTSPAGQTVTAGASVTLKTEASGAPAPAWQWYKNAPSRARPMPRSPSPRRKPPTPAATTPSPQTRWAPPK